MASGGSSGFLSLFNVSVHVFIFLSALLLPFLNRRTIHVFIFLIAPPASSFFNQESVHVIIFLTALPFLLITSSLFSLFSFFSFLPSSVIIFLTALPFHLMTLRLFPLLCLPPARRLSLPNRSAGGGAVTGCLTLRRAPDPLPLSPLSTRDFSLSNSAPLRRLFSE